MAAASSPHSAAPHATSQQRASSSDCSHAAFDVAIVGAGIIGLSTALALADAGLCVVAFDRRLAMHEASWAAAGMLAANDPGNPREIHGLSRYSESLYPEFLARIEALTGRKIPLRTRQALEGIPAGHALPSAPLSAAELQQLAPQLATGGLQFISLDESSLDPCDLTDPLPAAVRAVGVDLREHSPVLRVEREGESPDGNKDGHYRVVFSSLIGEASLTARHVVFATGAWAAPLPVSSAPVPLAAPRKGQLVALELDGPVQTACVLRIPGLYIVPRGNGTYVVGATLEQTGFDQATSEPLLADLARRAAALWPPLAKAKRVAAWAGLRPESPDGLPVIGPLAAEDTVSANLWIATGHFRNGILQAPGTARLVRDLILGQPLTIALERFRADRFAEELSNK